MAPAGPGLCAPRRNPGGIFHFWDMRWVQTHPAHLSPVCLKCEYRWRLCHVLCPVTSATRGIVQPISKSRDAPSCRKSWKCRPSIPSVTQARVKAAEIAMALNGKILSDTSGMADAGTPKGAVIAGGQGGAGEGQQAQVIGVQVGHFLRLRFCLRAALICDLLAVGGGGVCRVCQASTAAL